MELHPCGCRSNATELSHLCAPHQERWTAGFNDALELVRDTVKAVIGGMPGVHVETVVRRVLPEQDPGAAFRERAGKGAHAGGVVKTTVLMLDTPHGSKPDTNGWELRHVAAETKLFSNVDALSEWDVVFKHVEPDDVSDGCMCYVRREITHPTGTKLRAIFTEAGLDPDVSMKKLKKNIVWYEEEAEDQAA